ncbi:type 2 DNA topoisomerase 6 subunit B-like isoform X2 [Anneissia japonica]|uniref:type 2 DNA topoisomerase 6 subunit B-like isoform X2 n=1 Tax=Anneissia japonica TaxID=1529436 RepID=UPI001425AD0F|nr:type 2 DNA topoisomerase 6 subunit B-like isoform X2 [Anneissia japonica]
MLQVLEYIFLLQKQYTGGRTKLKVYLKEDLVISSVTTMCCTVEIEGEGNWTQHFSAEQLFSGEIDPLLSVLLDTVGTFEVDVKDFDENKIKHANVSVEDGDDMAIKFSRSDCTGNEKDFHCKYLIVVSRDKLLEMLVELKSYIHAVFLLNSLPPVELIVETSQHSETKIFGNDARSRVTSSGKRLVSDACYFTRLAAGESEHTRLCYKTSSKFLITSPMLSSEDQTSLKLFVTVATIPSSPSQQHTTKMLNIYFFGPDGLPLVLPGVSQYCVLPFQLAKWEKFGLHVGQQLERNHSNHGLVLPDQSYHLLRTSDASCTDDWQTLQLILLIDFNNHHSIKEKKEILEAVRSNLSSIVTEQGDKFRRATHKALTKLWVNKSTMRDKQKIVEQAVPVAVKAVGVIFKHSTNEEFRKKCLSKLQVCNSRELSAEMTARLWFIANRKFNVAQPANSKPTKSKTSTPLLTPSAFNSQHTASRQSNMSSDTTSFEEFGDIGLLVWDELKDLDNIVSAGSKTPDQNSQLEDNASGSLTNDDWFSQALTDCDWLSCSGPEE